MNPARRLTYRFFQLPYHVRLQVAQELHLVEDEDQELERNEQYPLYFRRAGERK